jgi:hypothetical protein
MTILANTDYQKLWTAEGGGDTSDEYLIPDAANVLLQMTQVLVTASTTIIEQQIPGDSEWVTIGTISLTALNESAIVVAAVPAGKIRFKITANNGEVDGAFASHYGR